MGKTLLSLLLSSFVFLSPLSAQDKPVAAVHGRGYKPMSPEKAKALHDAAFKRHGYMMKLLAKNSTPPAVFDCVTNGSVGPVVDQGSCGDCYGVSASDAMTGALILAGWGKNDGSLKISDQYGLDCGAYHGGCGGGDEAQVIDYMKQKGFPAEKYVDSVTGKALSDYGPYSASPHSCKLPSGAKMWKLADWGYVAGDQGSGPASLDEIKAALMKYGQLSIALDAGSFNNYSGGVIKNLGNSIDHAITMVGWDDTKKAVHCRNNWGTGWGEAGYCWISYDAVHQIVEPIWLLAPPANVPPIPPGPTPPGTLPVITSPLTANAALKVPFSYQIVATNSPTVYAATGLPLGFTCSSSGTISGTPTALTPVGTPTPITLLAINSSGVGTAVLNLSVTEIPVPPLNPVDLTLTPDQVASVIKQSGVITVTKDMTLQQLVDKCKAETPSVPEGKKPCGGDCDKFKKLEDEVRDLKRATEAIMKVLLPPEVVTPEKASKPKE